ncbi:MAG: hypothetical protein ABR589_13275, partial [Chthoniobacterales bacterium]
RWRILGWLVVGIFLGALLYAPMAPSLFHYFSARSSETGYPLLSSRFWLEIRPLAPFLLVAAIIIPALSWRMARRQPMTAALLLLPLGFTVLVPALRGQGMHPRSLIYGLPIAYFFLNEAIDWARLRFRWVLPLAIGGVGLISLAMLTRYYPLPKQGFQQALRYIETHRAPGDGRIGLSLGGKAARFYDPAVQFIGDADQLQEWLKTAGRPTWVLYTFENDLRATSPALYSWLMSATAPRAIFRGVIGDGAVHVRFWAPSPSPPSES